MKKDFESLYPEIQWREPLPVAYDDKHRFACRLCIAKLGLTVESPWQWLTVGEAHEHIEKAHPSGQSSPRPS